MKPVLNALGRLGGALATPRRTLIGVLEKGDGSVFEVLLFALVVGIIVQPTSAGQAFLLMRVSPLEGLMALSRVVFGRFGTAFVIVLVGAAIVFVLGRLRVGFDKILDACAYTLVPHFLLAAVGAALSNLGAELWFLPHRNLKGDGPYFLARLAAGYGWSVALLGLIAIHVLRRPREVE